MLNQRKITKGKEPCGGSLPLDFYFPLYALRSNAAADRKRILLVPSSVGHHDLPTGHGADVSRREKCFLHTLTDTAQSAE